MRRRTGVFLILVGVVCPRGRDALGDGRQPGIGLLGVVPMGIGCMAAGLTAFLTCKAGGFRLEQSSERRSGAAVTFSFPMTKQRLAFVGQVCFALLCLSLVLYADEFAGSRRSPIVLTVVGSLGVAFLGGFALATLPTVLRRRAGGVYLRPEGIEVSGGPMGGFVAWDDVEALDEREVRGNRVLEIRAFDPSRVETSAAGSVLRGINRPFGFHSDLSVAAMSLEADLDTVMAAIQHELLHPEHRERLGTPESLVDLGLTEGSPSR